MKKIVSVLQPFALTQDLIVYEDGNKLEIVPTTIEELNATVLKLVDKYNIEEIMISKGAKPVTRILTDEEYLIELNKKLENENNHNQKDCFRFYNIL